MLCVLVDNLANFCDGFTAKGSVAIGALFLTPPQKFRTGIGAGVQILS